MNRSKLLAGAACVLFAAGFPAFADTATEAAEAQAVLAAEDARFAAMVAGDAEAMRQAFAADLAYVHSTGAIQGRDELIEAIAGGQLRYFTLEPSERKVLILGPDAAYVMGLGHIRARLGDREVDFQARYLAIYGRTDGNWQLRAWQSLRLP